MTALTRYREQLLHVDEVADICIATCDDPKDKAEHERWRVSKKEELKQRLEKATKVADSFWRFSSQSAQALARFNRLSDSGWYRLWHDDARVNCPSEECRALVRAILEERLQAKGARR